MSLRHDEIKQLADALLKEWNIEKPRGYVSRTERMLRRLDVDDYDRVVMMVHAEKMKNPAAVEAEAARKQEQIDADYADKGAKKPGLFDEVTAADIAMEFHEASQLAEKGKTPRHDASKEYNGGGTIKPRTSISYDASK